MYSVRSYCSRIILCPLYSCSFDHNIAFSGSAIKVASYSRVDTASFPVEIHDW